MMKNIHAEGLNASTWRSPIGWLSVLSGPEGITEISCHSEFEPLRRVLDACGQSVPEGAESAEAMTQIQEYFKRERRTFSLRLSLGRLSPFNADILQELTNVFYGQTVTYGELAAKAGRPGAARAVGRAMAGNPFLIVIPCHRVLGAGGKMTGYSGGAGIATKEWLLAFERDAPGGSRGAVLDAPPKFEQRLKNA